LYNPAVLLPVPVAARLYNRVLHVATGRACVPGPARPAPDRDAPPCASSAERATRGRQAAAGEQPGHPSMARSRLTGRPAAQYFYY
jgi:hypothetical protein